MDLSLFEQFFHISVEGSASPEYSAPVDKLIADSAAMRDFLERGGALVQATGMELAVSYAGLAAYGLLALKQFAMSQYDRVLDLSPGNLEIRLEKHGDHAHIGYKIQQLRWNELPADACARRAAVEAEWSRYLNEEFNPFIEGAAAAGGLKPDLIWNQFGARAAFMIDYMRERLPAGPELARIEDDFALLASLPAEAFNRKRKNPFDFVPVYVDSPYQPGGRIMIRSACCMYDRRENGVKCYNCPLLKESERAARKIEIEAEIARKA